MYNNNSRAFRNRMRITPNDDKEKHDYYKSRQIKRKIKKAKEAKKQKYRGRIISLLMAGVLVIGSYNIAKANKANEANQISEVNVKPISTLEKTLKSGKYLEDLGINDSIRREINEIQNELNDKELNESELMVLSTRIYQLQYDTLTTKLSNILNVDDDKIKIDRTEVEPCEIIQSITAGNEVYTSDRFLKRENTISKEVEAYINDIWETKDFMVNMENLNRDDIYSYCQATIEYTDKFAATKICVDDKGNISMEDKIEKSKVNEYDEEER